jgi:hypothetical protein
MTNLERITAQKNEVDKNNQPLTPLTQEKINESPTFSSGREKKPGDWLIFGFLNEGDDTVALITLHEDEYGTLYEDHPRVNFNRDIILDLQTIRVTNSKIKNKL